MIVRIVTGWKGTGAANNPYRPAVADDHGLTDWVDTQGKDPTQGGTYTVETRCTQAQLDAIAADPHYLGKITLVLGGG